LKEKLALIAVSVILIASLVANIYFYSQQQRGLEVSNGLRKQAAGLQSQLEDLSNQTYNLEKRKTSLNSHLSDLENEIIKLQNLSNSLQNENAILQNENGKIQSKIDAGGSPKIVTRLGATDVRQSPAPGHPWSGQIRLYVSGEVWNVGTVPAQDCKLHVTLYHGYIAANETYIELGKINVGSWADVAANINYSGDPLTNWTIIPEYY
jgi:hypothetical protein